MKKREKTGFTLMEMLVVVAIIAVLVAIAIPTFAASLDRTREAACAANRRSLKAQLALQQMTAGGESLEEVSRSEPGKTWLADCVCPAGGKITVRENNILCNEHGDIRAPEQVAIDDFQDLADHWKDKERYPDFNSYKNNDEFRKYYYQKNGSKWLELTVDGATYYIQPYIDLVGDGKGDTYLFASHSSGLKDTGWKSPYFYHDGKWYATANGKDLMFSNQSWEELEGRLTELSAAPGDIQ